MNKPTKIILAFSITVLLLNGIWAWSLFRKSRNLALQEARIAVHRQISVLKKQKADREQNKKTDIDEEIDPAYLDGKYTVEFDDYFFGSYGFIVKYKNGLVFRIDMRKTDDGNWEMASISKINDRK